MSALTVGAAVETAPGERRVALSPDGATRLLANGFQVIVEAGAGTAACFPDSDYTNAGARLVTRHELYEQATSSSACTRRPRRTSACCAQVRSSSGCWRRSWIRNWPAVWPRRK